MIITSLVENDRLAGRQDLRAEHGVSIHIQQDDRALLFDTGASDAFAANARRLNIDLQRVDQVVLSHHHYDHAGGLDYFLTRNREATVYLGCAAPGEPYARVLGGLITRPIGMDRTLLQNAPKRFVELERQTEIAPDVFVLTDIPATHPLPPGNRLLYRKHLGNYEPDPFEHEVVLVLRHDGGLVVFTGCSHRGILNMLDAVLAAFPDQRIKALFGGFHLIGLPVLNTMAGGRAGVEALARALQRYPIDRAYTGHCTGPRAFKVLKAVLGDQLADFPTGSVVEL